jgi:hypothetical protein
VQPSIEVYWENRSSLTEPASVSSHASRTRDGILPGLGENVSLLRGMWPRGSAQRNTPDTPRAREHSLPSAPEARDDQGTGPARHGRARLERS